MTIDSITLTKFEKISEDLICSICNVLMDDPHALQCGHSFCGQCILTWLKVKKACPMCRVKISSMPTHINVLQKLVDTLRTADNEPGERLNESDWLELFPVLSPSNRPRRGIDNVSPDFLIYGVVDLPPGAPYHDSTRPNSVSPHFGTSGEEDHIGNSPYISQNERDSYYSTNDVNDSDDNDTRGENESITDSLELTRDRFLVQPPSDVSDSERHHSEYDDSVSYSSSNAESTFRSNHSVPDDQSSNSSSSSPSEQTDHHHHHHHSENSGSDEEVYSSLDEAHYRLYHSGSDGPEFSDPVEQEHYLRYLAQSQYSSDDMQERYSTHDDQTHYSSDDDDERSHYSSEHDDERAHYSSHDDQTHYSSDDDDDERAHYSSHSDSNLDAPLEYRIHDFSPHEHRSTVYDLHHHSTDYSSSDEQNSTASSQDHNNGHQGMDIDEEDSNSDNYDSDDSDY